MLKNNCKENSTIFSKVRGSNLGDLPLQIRSRNIESDKVFFRKKEGTSIRLGFVFLVWRLISNTRNHDHVAMHGHAAFLPIRYGGPMWDFIPCQI